MLEEKRWVGPLAGVLGVVLTIVALVLQGGDAPEFIDKDKQAVADFYGDSPDKLIASGVIDMFATVLLLVFAAALFSRIRAAGGTRAGAAASLAGAIAMASMFHLYDVVNLAGTFRADEGGGIDPEVAATLSDIGFVALGVAATSFAALWVGATAVSGLRTGALPKWLCYASLVLTVGLLIAPIAFIFLIGLLLWVLVNSVLMWRQAPAVEPA